MNDTDSRKQSHGHLLEALISALKMDQIVAAAGSTNIPPQRRWHRPIISCMPATFGR